MKISSYGLMALVILAMSAPAIVFAENEANEGTSESAGAQSATTEVEHEGNDNKTSSTNADLILVVTIAAIVSVVGYSSWKVYKIRRRAASKALV
jgi:hypothetical protein